MTTKLEKLRQGLDNLPKPAPGAEQAAPPKPKAEVTVPVNLRMPDELRAWFVQQAAKQQAESGRPTTAQQVMLEALKRYRGGA